MTDLQMTRLCAEAMGLQFNHSTDGLGLERLFVNHPVPQPDGKTFGMTLYDPIHDDAQAMALVKKSGVWIQEFDPPIAPKGTWWACAGANGVEGMDLNRCIVEAVARLQMSKGEKCPFPIDNDDGTALDCLNKGHCGCEFGPRTVAGRHE